MVNWSGHGIQNPAGGLPAAQGLKVTWACVAATVGTGHGYIPSECLAVPWDNAKEALAVPPEYTFDVTVIGPRDVGAILGSFSQSTHKPA